MVRGRERLAAAGVALALEDLARAEGVAQRAIAVPAGAVVPLAIVAQEDAVLVLVAELVRLIALPVPVVTGASCRLPPPIARLTEAR